MKLWMLWYQYVSELRQACSRQRTFLWMVIVLMAMCTRCGDCIGVSSFIRVLGLQPYCYDRLLDLFHTPALNLELLTKLWGKLVFKLLSGNLVTINGRCILMADGIKVSKEGKKMPAVKSLHQDSESNTKPEYVMGHSCQAVAVLVKAAKGFFSVPLISRIHEGLVFSNRDKSTLYDKLLKTVGVLQIDTPYYFVADAYYAVSKMVNGLLANGNHLVTRVKKNAVAFEPSSVQKSGKNKRGRPLKYGQKIKLNTLFNQPKLFTSAPSAIYGEGNTLIRYYETNLFWRPAGLLVKFVAVIHPQRGKVLLLTTDLELSALDVIKIYGLRFKIEVSFKQSLHTIGAYSYRFWIKKMKPIKRKSGNQYLHRESDKYRHAVKRKMAAYHRHIQLALIAQGLLQMLATTHSTVVWKQFGSWLRTIRPGIAPSEQVTAMAMRNSLPEFLADNLTASIFKKFLINQIDFSRAEGVRLAA